MKHAVFNIVVRGNRFRSRFIFSEFGFPHNLKKCKRSVSVLCLSLENKYRIEMVIEYTDHAMFRMKHRAISRAYVDDTIQNSDFDFITHRGRSVALKKYGDKFLKVVYEKSNSKITVITVYWTRRLQR
jgi:hypothetical protein